MERQRVRDRAEWREKRKKKESEQFLSLTFVIRYEQEVKLSISLLLFYVLQVTLFLCVSLQCPEYEEETEDSD